LRTLAMSKVPTPLPEINISAFHLVAAMSSDLHQLLEVVTRSGGLTMISGHLMRIEGVLCHIRASLLNATQRP
ncbi:MAG: hypothetical protein M3Z35_09080, partial [Nitrospirota bacterium]|nr:hypothetical protein [Nitrospirota bacterium]